MAVSDGRLCFTIQFPVRITEQEMIERWGDIETYKRSLGRRVESALREYGFSLDPGMGLCNEQ